MDPSANLRAAIADLKQRRAEMDDAIASMEMVLATMYGAKGAAQAAAPRSGQYAARTIGGTDYMVTDAEIPLNRTEKVRKAFDDYPDKSWSTLSLAGHIGEPREETVIKSIGAILSRMNQADQIERVGRGHYRSKNASAPAVTGAEETGESNSDSPLQEGDRHGSATSVGRDDRALDAHDPHGHGDRRAAIVGGSMTL